MAAAAAVLDPEMIVVSGYLDEPVAAHLREVLRTLDADGPDVVPGHLGEEAVLLGALAAGLPAAHERVFARSQDPLPEAQRSRQASGDSVTAASAMR